MGFDANHVDKYQTASDSDLNQVIPVTTLNNLRLRVEDPGKIWEFTLSEHKKKMTSNRKYFDLIFPLSKLATSLTILDVVQKLDSVLRQNFKS